MRRPLRVVGVLLLCATAILWLAPPAMADHCGTPSDCFGAAGSFNLAALGLLLFAGLSLALDFVPVVGTAKGVVEAVTGRDLITGQKLSWWKRALGVVPVIGGIAAVGSIARAADTAADLGGMARSADTTRARFGTSTSTNYRDTFFDANPDLRGDVVVHHAVEQQARTRYPDVVSESEMHSLDNLRGIPKDQNPDIHLSKIRKAWNEFYRTHPTATQDELLEFATTIDDMYGHLFKPPVR